MSDKHKRIFHLCILAVIMADFWHSGSFKPADISFFVLSLSIELGF